MSEARGTRADFVHKDSLPLRSKLEHAEHRLATLKEVERRIPLMEEDPLDEDHVETREAAEAAKRHLVCEIADLRGVILRIDAGYHFFEWPRFVEAVETSGELLSISPISAAAETVALFGSGNPQPMPELARAALSDARASGHFNEFIYACEFGPPTALGGSPTGKVQHFIFGIHLTDSGLGVHSYRYLVASW